MPMRQSFFEDESDSTVGSGMFICDEPVQQKLIDEAMEKLRNDDDKNEQDEETLERGYFHASEDSKNAHSHLCRAIYENLDGEFIYTFYDKSIDGEYSENPLNFLYIMTLELSSIPFFQSREPVDLLIEERDNFTSHQVNDWLEGLYQKIERSIFDLPEIPNTFPKFDVETDTKYNPGLQVADFILWSLHRHHNETVDDHWVDRLELKLSENFDIQRDPVNGGTYYLHNRIDWPHIKYPGEYLPIEKIQTKNECVNLYAMMERAIKALSNADDLPDHSTHLEQKLNEIVQQLDENDGEFDPDLIPGVSSIFLRVFDTVPIYDEFDGYSDEERDECWNKILKARELASRVMRPESFGNKMTEIQLGQIRAALVKESPDILEPDEP